MTSFISIYHWFGRIAFLSAAVMLALAAVSCRKEPEPVVRTHPELLLELNDAAAIKDYKGMLPKLRRLRAIDPTNAFLAELETRVRVNILVEEINHLAAEGRYTAAIEKINQFEQVNGPDSAADQAKELLETLRLADALIRKLKHPTTAAVFGRNLNTLENLSKKFTFSKKLQNFTVSKRSELKDFIKAENAMLRLGLWSDALRMKQTGDHTYSALSAVLAMEQENFPSIDRIITDSRTTEINLN